MGADTKRILGVAAHLSSAICVSLSTAASAEAPLAPISFQLRLRTRGGAGMVGEQAIQRALTQKRTLYGAAAHFSSLSTRFPLMQLAIMMAEATPSPLRERSIFSVGFVPLSSSI